MIEDNTKSPLLYLDSMLDAIEHILKYTKNKQFSDYQNDSLLQDGIHMRLQMLGEAVSKLPVELRDSYPDIPWNEIRALRHVISHDYTSIKPERIWNTIENDLMPLAEELKKIIKDLEKK